MENFAHLPHSARVWVYQADRAFAPSESAQIAQEIKTFVSQWLAHKAKVIGDGELLFDRFVILAADEEKLQVSGCSIDSTVRFIKELGTKYNVNFFDRFYTCYIQDREVKGLDFESFKKEVASGTITDDTLVFNNLVTTIDALNSQWQIPLSLSWHKKFVGQEVGFKL
ncbi:MAG: transporter ATPase [Bacteroidetes bacterium]|nr:transporter ATPase [Bacteroidota bacterium]